MKRQLLILLLIIPLLSTAQTYKNVKHTGSIKAGFTEGGNQTVNELLAEEFAKFLNVELEKATIEWGDVFAKNGKIPENYQTDPKISYTPDALKKSDFICGTVYELDWRKKFFDYAGIVQVSDLLIVRKNIPANINSIQDLNGLTIAFLENSTYETEINAINEEINGAIKLLPVSSEKEGLNILTQGKADGLITVSYLALAYLKKYQSLKLAFPVSEPQNVGWVIRKNNEELKQEIENFFETIKGDGTLNKIFREKYGISYSTYLEIINSYAQSKKGTDSRDFDAIKESGKIIIALRDREMIYHRYGQKQFNHYLAEEFAQYLGLQHEIVITQEFSDYWENEEGEILKDSAYLPQWFTNFDVACDLIAPLDWRLKKVDVIDFMPNAMVVIGRKGTKINSVDDLRGLRGITSRGSSYEHALKQNNIKDLIYSQGNEFFKNVISGRADYTISNIAVFNLSEFPELEAKFILGEITQMGWAIKKNQPALRQKVLEFFEYAQENGIIDNYFKEQTGMTMKSARNYLNALQETYQHGFFPFMFYGADQGLPREEILTLFQDNKGYIWFGTYSGAVKYNGRDMRVFNKENGLSNNTVFDIKQDKKGRMYFAGENGVNVSDENTASFKSVFEGTVFKEIFIDQNQNKFFYGDAGVFLLDKKDNKIHLNNDLDHIPKNVRSMTQSEKGGDIIIASTEGIYRLNSTLSVADKISDGYYHYALFSSDGNLWVSSDKGLFFVQSKHFTKPKRYENLNTTLNIPKHTTIRKIKESEDGAIWLLSDYKVYQILTLKQKPIVYDKDIGLNNYKILSFLIDKERNFWFGLAGGTQKLTDKTLRTLFPQKLNSPVHTIFEDKSGRIWFGMHTGIYYLQNGLHNFSKEINFGENSMVFSQGQDGKLYLADTEKILIIRQEDLKPLKTIRFDEPIIHPEKIFVSSKGEIFITTGINGIVYYLENAETKPLRIENNATQNIMQLSEFDNKIIGAANDGIVLFNNKSFRTYIRTDGKVSAFAKDIVIDPETQAEDTILRIAASGGMLIFHPKDKMIQATYHLPKGTVIKSITPAEDTDYLWLGTASGLIYFNKNTGEADLKVDSKNGLNGNEITSGGLYLDGRGVLWVGTFHGASTYDIKNKRIEKIYPSSSISNIELNGESISQLPKMLKSNENNISFEISGLLFKDEKSIEYEYYLRGLDTEYAGYKGKDNIAVYQNLPAGKYEFLYRAKGKDGIWSYFQSVEFTIEKPIYAKWWFILIMAILAAASVYGVFKWRIKILKRRNEILEETVKERTLEIREKNAELESQKEEIETQRELAVQQRDEISEKKKEIEDSILYAERIQTAILPPKNFISRHLPENFILFKPRDIVSGDFYWAAENDKKIFIAAADCTGHGVPGAFMSMLGVSFLNDIVATGGKDITAGVILDKLRDKIIDALHQTGEVHEAKDGMDIALCAIHKGSDQVDFAGAFNPLYLVRDGEIHVTEADRMPIGIYEYEDDNKDFTNQEVRVKKGDTLYMFSDGYPDQFGGKRGKKFMIGRFKKLILKVQDLPLDKQRDYMDDTIQRWMEGSSEQIDDILVIGVKI
jgi:ABC-type amino acid transport substrate-binding protein/serine phosphatase RsbU (regulator of sigma subunit)/ligand-binding sensor domain-containing protein